MEHVICLNSNSFPAENKKIAMELFEDALQGVLALNNGVDRYALFHDDQDGGDLNSFQLADDFSFQEFKNELKNNNDMDLLLFLEEIDDKSPALDFITEDVFDDIATFSFYMPNQAIPLYPDVLGLSWFLQAVLLSIPTQAHWDTERVFIARTEDGRYVDERLTLKNIARLDHGQQLFDDFNAVDIQAICQNCHVTSDFIDWYEDLKPENQLRVSDKLKLAVTREFNGGEPLFKTLNDAEGLREIRFSAYAGGAIRLLFKSLAGGQQAILLGFLKKSNREGYSSNIDAANDLYGEIEQVH
ncbi:type II toxin-antitoxin system RelE/ParE family toxin [Paraglaciecola sp. 20A4]|uniref:type II toxin-antitoxin system RelE/ParE family toxin n=1 Tax=Paraglaciecola sp. 20A4 TaxID=2687288 RepID=UPI00140B7542|nr:type II toxin-antitoxin system RelE/ParE family toxin [Paraglaciecola sp. 20A4]